MTPRFIVSLVALFLVGCGVGGKVCSVVDLAHHACTVVKYLGPDGKEHEVKLTPEEARELAMEAEAKQAARAAKDAGADAR
jgi:hypothetical protein